MAGTLIIDDAKNATAVVMDVTNVAEAALGRAAMATCTVVDCGGHCRRFIFHLSTTTKISSAPRANTMKRALTLANGKLRRDYL